MKIPTLSRADRWAEDPASAALPQVDDATSSDAADNGHIVHRFAERAPEIGSDAALAEIPADADDARRACEGIDVARLPSGPGTMRELVVSWDMRQRVSAVHRDRADRAYGSSEDVLCGTLDVARLDGETLHAWEYKSGPASDRVPNARVNRQVRWGASILADALGATRAVVHVVRIGASGWIDDGDQDELDALDLLYCLDEIDRTWRASQRAADVLAAGGTPDVRAGAWCSRCPAYRACPAKSALMRAAVSTPQAVLDKAQALLSDESTAPRAYEAWRALADLAGKLGQEIHAHASRQPIALGNGMVFGPRPTERTTIDGRVAWDVVVADVGVESALEACELKTSKAALERAAKSAGKKAAPTVRAWIEQIEQRGGVERKTSTRVEEYRDATQIVAPEKTAA